MRQEPRFHTPESAANPPIFWDFSLITTKVQGIQLWHPEHSGDWRDVSKLPDLGFLGNGYRGRTPSAWGRTIWENAGEIEPVTPSIVEETNEFSMALHG